MSNQETTEYNQPPQFLFVNTSAPLTLYISMPMHGKDLREIHMQVKRIKDRVEGERNMKIKNVQYPPPVYEMEEYSPLEYLADRLKRIAKAGCVVFSEDYRSSRLCLIEFFCARMCGKGIMIETAEEVKSADEYCAALGIDSDILFDYTEKS